MLCFIDLFAPSKTPRPHPPPPPTPPTPLKKKHSPSLSVNRFNSYCGIFSDFQDEQNHRSLPTVTFIVNLRSMCSYTQKVLIFLFPSQKMLSCFVLINLFSNNVNFVSLYLTCHRFLYDILRCIPWFFKFFCVFATA